MRRILFLSLIVITITGCKREPEYLDLEKINAQKKVISLEKAKKFFIEEGCPNKDFRLEPKWETFTQQKENDFGDTYAYVDVVLNENPKTNVKILFKETKEKLESRVIVLKDEGNKKISVLFTQNGKFQKAYIVDGNKTSILTERISQDNATFTMQKGDPSPGSCHFGGGGVTVNLDGVDVYGPKKDKGNQPKTPFFPPYISPSDPFLPPSGGGISGGQKSIDKNNLKDKCASEIIDEMKSEMNFRRFLNQNSFSGGNFNIHQHILDLFDKSSRTNLTFKSGILNGENAHTVGSTITLDENYLKNATRLSIARTIMHESIHAYLNAYFYQYPDFQNKDFSRALQFYLNSFGKDMNGSQHELMVNYVEAMSKALYEWDRHYNSGHSADFDYCKSLCYAGLSYKTKDSAGNDIYEDSDAFKNMVPNKADRDKIKEKINNENTGNRNAKSSKCK